jgi:hypothetical protein
MEVLENAAKSHDPKEGGQIIPYASLPGVLSEDVTEPLASQNWTLRCHQERGPGKASAGYLEEREASQPVE